MPILHISIAYIDITDTEMRKREILCCFSEKKTAKETLCFSRFFMMKGGYRAAHCLISATTRNNHKVAFLIVFFSLVRKERKGQKEECFPLLNSFCRLAATSANKAPRPSNCSITIATDSKRLSADSDSLLYHVRLWRTSRELTDSRKRTRSASPRQGGRSLGACLGANIAR